MTMAGKDNAIIDNLDGVVRLRKEQEKVFCNILLARNVEH